MKKGKIEPNYLKTTYCLLERQFSFWLWELGHLVGEGEPSSYGWLFFFCLGLYLFM